MALSLSQRPAGRMGALTGRIQGMLRPAARHHHTDFAHL